MLFFRAMSIYKGMMMMMMGLCMCVYVCMGKEVGVG